MLFNLLIKWNEYITVLKMPSETLNYMLDEENGQ